MELILKKKQAKSGRQIFPGVRGAGSRDFFAEGDFSYWMVRGDIFAKGGKNFNWLNRSQLLICYPCIVTIDC